jgi:penicillin-binding protein 2
MKFKKAIYNKKFALLSFITTSTFIFIAIHLFHLQIINNEFYKSEVSSAVIKQHKIAAPRGNILDRNGIVLASNYFDGYSFKRAYNANTATQHLIGYVGRITMPILETDNDDGLYAYDDTIGKSGLEYIYNHQLHGVNGANKYVVTANGVELPIPNRFLRDSYVKPVKGIELNLSIDDRIQLVFAKEIGNRNGAGVMLDVNTGAVIALYSSPVFDQGHITGSFKNASYPLINRTMMGYAPGSTFKLVTALAALELGIITPDTKFDCPGYYDAGGRRWLCWKHGVLGDGHGKIALNEAIKSSCDVFFYQLAKKVGLVNIIRYAHMLGFDEYTGIDLDSETKGNLPKTKTEGELLNSVIGQGEVLATPLQLARAYGAIVNGGKLYRPQIVNAPSVLIQDNNFNPANVEILMNAMYDVVNTEGGTAYYSAGKIAGIEIGGKTGSAQTAAIDKKTKDNGVFVGYFPIKNPKVVVCILVEQAEHGSLIAPIAFKAIQEYAKYNAPIKN